MGRLSGERTFSEIRRPGTKPRSVTFRGQVEDRLVEVGIIARQPGRKLGYDVIEAKRSMF